MGVTASEKVVALYVRSSLKKGGVGWLAPRADLPAPTEHSGTCGGEGYAQRSAQLEAADRNGTAPVVSDADKEELPVCVASMTHAWAS